MTSAKPGERGSLSGGFSWAMSSEALEDTQKEWDEALVRIFFFFLEKVTTLFWHQRANISCWDSISVRYLLRIKSILVLTLSVDKVVKYIFVDTHRYFVCTCLHVSACMCMCVYVHAYLVCICMHKFVYTCRYVVCLCIYRCVCICMCVCV